MPSSVPTLMPPADSPKIVTFAGIAAEGRDVVAHPGERGDLIEQPGVRGARELFARQLGQVQEAERAEPVVDGHHHDVAAPHERPPS